MGNRKIEMHAYRTIIYRLQAGQTIRSIAKEGLMGRKKITVIKEVAEQEGWLKKEATLPEEKELALFFDGNKAVKQASLAACYAEQIESWVKANIQASVIHLRLVEEYGLKGGYNSVQRFVKKIKKKLVPPDLTVPLHFKPGEAAQVDFGAGPMLFDKRVNKKVKTWFFVMTLCWSRHQYVELVTHQNVETWLKCHQNAFNWFGGVPGKIIIDNAKCAIITACYYDPQVQCSFEKFSQEYGFIISACPPRDPQKKGRVESGVKYVKNNFLPLRDIKDLQQGNEQLKRWMLGTAGNRIHGSTFEKPLTRFTEIEQSQLKALSANPPEIAVWSKVPLYRDCHVRYLKCKYSAPHTLYGEELWLKVTRTLVSVYHQHELKAAHPRLFVPGQCSTKLEHLPPNARFYLKRDANWCLQESQHVGESCAFVIENLLTDPVRDLLRQAQSIIELRKPYGKKRLEKACQRAIAFNTSDFKTIRTILKDGLDNEHFTSEASFNSLSSIYQGKAVYQRFITDVIH